MQRAIIFANGRMDTPPPIIKDIRDSDILIAVDGGTKHCKALGITPSVIIGDMDSLEDEELAPYRQAGVETIQYPSHKDETDLELALELVLNYPVRQVCIVGALGERWDMTFANVLLAANPRFSKLAIRLMDGYEELVILHGKEQIDIEVIPGTPISLIPLAGDAHGITTKGLEYPLAEETLYMGSPRGVSNIIIQPHAHIYLREGILLVCFMNKPASE